MTAAVLTQVTNDIAALNVAITAASPLNNASLATLAPAILLAQTAVADIDKAILATDALILTSPSTGVSGVVAGGFAPNLAASLLSQLATMQNEGVLMIQKGAIGRALFNLSNATG